MDCNNRINFSYWWNICNLSLITMNEIKYSFWIGMWKTVKNSAYLLIPFVLALLAGVPSEYAWITGPVVYFLKNYYQNRN